MPDVFYDDLSFPGLAGTFKLLPTKHTKISV